MKAPTLISVSSAKFVNGQNTAIDCKIITDQGGPWDYTAMDKTGDALVQAVWDACKEAGSIAAYVPPAPAPAPTVAQQIATLERSVTARMYQEAVSNSTLVFPAGSPYAGKTSAQAIAVIRQQIETLKGQL